MRIRRLIERQDAANHIFMLLISFAGAILVTRIFLALTGYPQIGSSQLHIAHVLWGGLIVGVGAALPLIYANRSIYDVSAILSGIGLGLFFDEVGKFLTRNNDYFFRPAASIIYILFLVGIYVYIMVRRGEPDAQSRLHSALMALQEVVDGDLDVREKTELETLLNGIVGDAEVPDMRELAAELLDFMQNQASAVPARPNPLRENWERASRWIKTHVLTRSATRWLLIISTALMAILSLADVITLARAIGHPDQIAILLQGWVARDNLTSAQEGVWFTIMVGLKGIVGLSLVTALVFFALGRDRRGIIFALAGLLLSVTVLDVLLFYFQQFVAAVYATVEFALIAGLSAYNSHYLRSGAAPPRQQTT